MQAGLEAAEPRHGLGAQFLDYNGDGRPDLYVANDEDPNQLYEDVPWPGGAKADPAGLGFRFEERGAAEGVADPFAGMGVASDGRSLFVTNSRHEPSAMYRRAAGSPAFANARATVDPALGSAFAGWGASFVDLRNTGNPALVLAAGAIPVTSLANDAEPVRVLGPVGGRYGDARGALGPAGLRLNGRGLAAADVGNDGRMDVAISTIGGKLVLLAPQGPSGHWLDVKLARFAPGAAVTAVLPDGRRLTGRVQAGSSYLSSEDPRVHLGLGSATRVSRLTVRYPWGGSSTVTDVRADRIVEVPAPRPAPVRVPAAVSAHCTRANLHGQSIATFWNRAAIDALREGDAAEPVQARDLFDLSSVAFSAYQRANAAGREAAISYASYRLLVWRASFDSNLSKTFALLTARLRSLCYSPDVTSTTGASPAALGNRIAAAAIAAGRGDGSLEALHYVDASYTPMNGPLVLAQSGSTVHDPTFWQPLALGQIAAHGLGAIPAQIQSFVDAQWGHVRRFANGPRIDPGAPPFGDPSAPSYQQAAVAVIRATAAPSVASPAAASPLAWNRIADTLSLGLRRDVELHLVLNGALNDAAIAVWSAKRKYQAPRPVSMIRYLAFQGQSSDPKAALYNREGLPLVPGLVEVRDHELVVRVRGRWVPGARWTPPSPTPASPGWVSERSAFAAAAAGVLTALTGRSFEQQAAGGGERGRCSGDRDAGRRDGRSQARRRRGTAGAPPCRRASGPSGPAACARSCRA